MKNEKGITLVALVITIIVMLILVAVTINIATDGGLFDTARNAANGTNSAAAEETKTSEGKVKYDTTTNINGVTYKQVYEITLNEAASTDMTNVLTENKLISNTVVTP